MPAVRIVLPALIPHLAIDGLRTPLQHRDTDDEESSKEKSSPARLKTQSTRDLLAR
jgi:hypothetical protein